MLYSLYRTHVTILLPVLPVPQLLKDVVPALRCITDREAVNVGTFLYETFATLNHWRSSEEVRAPADRC